MVEKMAKNILDEIVQRRKDDIEKLGWNLGVEIPSERKRKIVPFVANKGAVLEIKRASPSKGDIAPDLDVVSLAKNYESAGACAISVLTENNYFKGSLEDLKTVASTVNDVAVLRKDFLIDEKEIQIAFNCGADAVLLIARILDDEKIVSMAKKCQSLGITAFIELRLDDDVRKLSLVQKEVDSKFIVCGVNARDLSNFSIDMLAPSKMLKKIQKVMGEDARVIFESGIRTPEAAAFAGSLGFTGMLLGEVAARDGSKEFASDLVRSFVQSKQTSHSIFWTEFAEKLSAKTDKKPLVKICGITNFDDAKKCCELGTDFLGFIFYEKSARKIQNYSVIAEVKKAFPDVKLCGVIVDVISDEAKTAIQLCSEGILDVIQTHGFECSKEFALDENLNKIPHYAVVHLTCDEDMEKFDQLRMLGLPRILVDSKTNGLVGGTGIRIEDTYARRISNKTKLWLAGGINVENAAQIINDFSPELVDCATGVESECGKKDFSKLESLFEKIK